MINFSNPIRQGGKNIGGKMMEACILCTSTLSEKMFLYLY